MKRRTTNRLAKLTLLVLLVGGVVRGSYGQTGVGIGIPNPDPSSILHVQPPSGIKKGLLIPSLSTADRLGITSPAEGLLVFDTDLKRFCFFNGGWYTINEMTNVAGTSGITHTGNVVVTGTVQADNYGLNATGNGPIPQGGIIMWSGSTLSIPTGWALCNGQNGTPDLRDRFIVGAGASYTPGATGGQNSVTLDVTQMPSHTHGVIDPQHRHAESYFEWKSNTWKGGGDSSPGNETGKNSATTTGYSSTNISIQNTGGSQPHENRPPYFALAYIMKL